MKWVEELAACFLLILKKSVWVGGPGRSSHRSSKWCSLAISWSFGAYLLRNMIFFFCKFLKGKKFALSMRDTTIGDAAELIWPLLYSPMLKLKFLLIYSGSYFYTCCGFENMVCRLANSRDFVRTSSRSLPVPSSSRTVGIWVIDRLNLSLSALNGV